MKTYAFRTTHNLMYGSVFITGWKYAAMRWVKCDLYPNWFDLLLGLFILEIGADGYIAESKKEVYPAPNEIVEYERKK